MPASGFLIDSRTVPWPEPFLDGYAFAGGDVIVGTEGLTAMQAAGRPDLPLGADGVFLRLERMPYGLLRLSTDGSGYRHLFYHAEGPSWAVAESFVDLVAHLRAQGVPLTENRAHAAALLSRKQAFHQLTTPQTAIREITLLRCDEYLDLTDTGLSVGAIPAPPSTDYTDALRAFLETWLTRLAALHTADGLRMCYHLSGGLDSRVMIAFLHHLRRRGLVAETGWTVRSLTDAGHAKDHAIAQGLAAAIDLPLNRNRSDAGHQPFGHDAQLSVWRQHSAGCYLPLRFVATINDPAEIHVSGHAGEGLRYPQTPAQLAAFRRRMRRAYGFFGKGNRAAWERDFAAELSRLQSATDDPGLVYNAFLRRYRARFHAGQSATYKTTVFPFASRLAEAAADARPASGQRPFLLHYDALANLAPALLDLPFDSRKKTPTQQDRLALTRLASLEIGSGRVFGSFPARPEQDPPGKPARTLAQEVANGWDDLPRGRTTWLWRWKLRRLLAQIARGRTPGATSLRHVHGAWLFIWMKRQGVRFD